MKKNVCGKLLSLSFQNKLQPSEKKKFPKEDNTLITNKEEVAMELNNFFSNAVINLKNSELENFLSTVRKLDHPTLKAIAKYRKHPSIIAIASEFTKEWFSVNKTIIEETLKSACDIFQQPYSLLTYQ